MSDEILNRLTGIERKLDAMAARPAAGHSQACTQEAFNRLPALVSRAEFLQWTGYDKNELKDEVAAGRVQVHRRDGHTKVKYFKTEIARLGGWKL